MYDKYSSILEREMDFAIGASSGHRGLQVAGSMTKVSDFD